MKFEIKNITPVKDYIDGNYQNGLIVELIMSATEGHDDYRFVTEIFLSDSESLSVSAVKDRAIELAKEKLKKASNEI
ncbi:hypothetical protein [Xenorhabdus sp. KK7.4]|uniref:hypothetical protein n=1 Tax=Xenorhabdus TaxID=626 RepID=UPI000C054419|nr:hypothetical protein [Xenorhabdus sp. KK7.4]PHM55125.1 hypothetical protein Xekk_02386 [Xenorhabdus sp. KK7.4]